MRTLFLALPRLAGLCGTVRAADAPVAVADQAAIRSVITDQIDAFRRDDAASAFSLAAPAIQGMFQTPGDFIEMVRRGYAAVYRPRSFDFTSLTQEDGTISQFVDLIGPDGAAYTARYMMEREPDGSWRISGCEIVQSRRLGV